MQFHPLVARAKSQAFIETQRIRATLVRRQLHHHTSAFPCTLDGPAEHPLAVALTPQAFGHAHALDLCPLPSLVGQRGQITKLHDSIRALPDVENDEFVLRIAVDRVEGRDVCLFQGEGGSLSPRAQRIVGQ